MRTGLIFLAFITYAFNALSESDNHISHCASLENYLIAIDHKLQGHRPQVCSTKDPINKNCPSLYELELKRNDLMSQLVLAESTLALGQVIEADSIAIKRLSSEELDQTQEKISTLLFNIEKSELITQAIENNIFEDLDRTIDFPHFLEKLDERCTKNASNLCQNIAGHGPEQKHELQVTLYGLNRSLLEGISERDRAEQLKKIQAALGIVIIKEDDDEAEVTLADYKQELSKLQNEIRHYQALDATQLQDKHEDTKESKANNIINLANDLAQLRVGSDSSEQLRFDPALQNALNSTSQALRLLTQEDKVLENLKTLQRVNKRSQQVAQQNLTSQIKEDTQCNESRFEHLKTCFKNRRDRANGPQRAKLDQINERIEQYERSAGINTPLEDAIHCLEDNQNSDNDCLKNIYSELNLNDPATISAIQRQIAQTETQIQELNGSAQLHSLQRSKALALTVYERHGCVADKNQIQKTARLKPVCHLEETSIFSQNILELAENTGKIIEYGTNPFLYPNLKMTQSRFAGLTQEFLNECESSNNENDYLCKLFLHNTTLNGQSADNIQKAMRRSESAHRTARAPARGSQALDFSKVEDETPSAWGAAGLGLTNVLVGQGVPLFIEHDQRQFQHEMQMNHYRRQLDRQRKQREFYNTVQGFTHQYPGQNFYSNYGPYHFRYDNLPTYGGANSQLYYNPTDFTQFSFSPQVMSEFGSNQFTPNAATSSSNQGDFGFNFSN